MSAGWRFLVRAGHVPAFLAVLMPLALAFAAPCQSSAQAQTLHPQAQTLHPQAQTLHPQALAEAHLPAPGSYPSAILLDPAFLSTTHMFRFSSSSPWRPFDRVLMLDAFPGEYRTYKLELLSNMSAEVLAFEYVIDRQPPGVPLLVPESGDVGDTLMVGLIGEGSLMLSLNGGAFLPFNSGTPLTMDAPPDGSSIITALAYAVDEHGNASLPSFATWRLSHLEASSLPVFEPGLKNRSVLRVLDTIDGLSLRVGTEPGANPTVILDVPDGVVPVISVQSSRDTLSEASFIRISPSAGRASAEIPVPWGYDLELTVRYGYEDDGGMTVSGKSSSIRADFPFRGPPVPPAKAPAPVLSTSFGATLVSWPPSMTEMYYSLDGSASTRYQEPLLLPYRGPKPYELTYQAANAGGRSSTVSLSIAVLPRLEAPQLSGVVPGATYGMGPVIRAGTSYGAVRFEMTMDGSEPAPPGSGSPAITDSTTFGGIAGKHVQYRLRFAAVDDKGTVGPERFLDFFVDQEAPSVPMLAQTLPAYSADDLVLAFKSAGADAIIHLSLSDDGSSRFQELEGPVILSGSDDGRKRYIVRAFSEDSFGNRSAEMPPVVVLVDRSSLYVDPAGKSGATGTPSDPIPSLQEALQVSATTGRRIIYLRGNHVLTSPILVAGSLKLLGGYTAEWAANQRERASIRFSRPLATGTAGLRVANGLLEMNSVGLLAEGTGVSVLIDAKNASLVFTQVSLVMSGGLESTVIKLDSSKLVMDGADIVVSSVVTGRALDSIDSDCELDGLAVSGDSTVRLFDALRMVGGQSTIRDLRMDASPGLAFSGLSLSRTRVSMSGSAFFIKGGASTLRLVNLNAADLIVDTLFGDVIWSGEAELFRLGSSSNLRLAHATVLAKAKRLSVVEYRDSAWNIINSIFNADSPSAFFASGDSPPLAGAVGANCLWGFSAFLSGSGRSGSLAELNGHAISGHPNFIEAPAKTFALTNKGLPRLSSSSACVGNAAPLPWSLPASLHVELRALVSRDIGVDGLQEGRL